MNMKTERHTLRGLTLLFCSIAMVLPAKAQEATPAGPVLFTNVNVFDGVNEALIENANVVVTGNLITAGFDRTTCCRRRQGDRRWWQNVDTRSDRRALAYLLREHPRQYARDR